MSFWKSNEQRLEVVNQFIDLIPVLQKFSSRWLGRHTLHKTQFDEILLHIDGYEARVIYSNGTGSLDLISLYHDADAKSEGVAFDSFDFTSVHYIHGLHIHQRGQYLEEMSDMIDQMNNTFSTGYLPEEDHFQYSTLFDVPPYEELGAIYETMHRCLDDFGFQIRFTQFENLPMPAEQFMARLKEGIDKNVGCTKKY